MLISEVIMEIPFVNFAVIGLSNDNNCQIYLIKINTM